MTLKEKLEKLKKSQDQNTEEDWEKYKEVWKGAILDLYNTITERWLEDYEADNLMEFSITNTSRIDPYLGAYLTQTLEITLTNNKYIVLEPISGITTEYDGKLEFYMRGNINKKANILRKITGDNTCDWIIATSYDAKDYLKLDKTQLEQLIDQWLQ